MPLLLDACFCPLVQPYITFIFVCRKYSLSPSISRFHLVSVIFVVVFIFGSLTFIRCTGHRRFSKILVRHLQELHAHNHIHSVWIDVDLANFFVYVWNQFVCKSIMSECNHLSFVLPYQKQNTKPTKTFSLCAYEHWPHLLYIYLLWIANTKTNWSNRHSMWNFEIPAAEWQIERKKKYIRDLFHVLSIHTRTNAVPFRHYLNVSFDFHQLLTLINYEFSPFCTCIHSLMDIEYGLNQMTNKKYIMIQTRFYYVNRSHS